MIEKFSKIKNHGVFSNFAWDNELFPFKEFNLLYGWNASGKTTLSKILRKLEKKQPITAGDVELQVDGRKVDGSAFDSDQSLPSVRVFNRDFIEDAVFKGKNADGEDQDMNPIFYIGEESVDAKKQIEKLEAERKTAKEKLGEKSKAARKASKAFEKHKVDQALIVKNSLRSSETGNRYNNYNKANYKKKADAISKADDTNTCILSESEFTAEKERASAKQQDSVSKPDFSFLDLASLRDEVIAVCKTKVVSQVLDRLKDDEELSFWSKSGLSLHKDRESKTCLYCQQPLPKGTLEQLEHHFSDSLEKLTKEIEDLEQKLEDAKTDAQAVKKELPKSAELYSHLKSEYSTSTKAFNAQVKNYATAIDELLAVSGKKKAKPFDEIEVPKLTVSVDTTSLDSVFDFIESHNTQCTNHATGVSQARTKVENSIVAQSLVDYKKLGDAANDEQDAVDTLSNEITDKTTKITELEDEMLEHQKAGVELNDDLVSYLGRDDLQLSMEEKGYKLTRNGVRAENLSEGEKTAIALLYFLKTLEDESFAKQDGVVVIDDPVSSLDANSLFHAFGFLKSRTADVGQLIIMTHNFSFFRQVKNWFNHMRHQNKKDHTKRPAAFYHVCCSRKNSTRQARIDKLDPLLHEFESEYHYLFKLVYDAAKSEAATDQLAEYYHLPNVARRLLEAFLAFQIPDVQGELFSKFQQLDFDEAKKTRILRFLHVHSHNDEIEEPDHDLLALSEGKEVLENVLKLMESVGDGKHYSGMVALIERKEDEEEA